MAHKEMTVAEYASAREIVPGTVRKAIKLGHALPGVISRRKFGNAHVLTVDPSKLKTKKPASKKAAKKK